MSRTAPNGDSSLNFLAKYPSKPSNENAITANTNAVIYEAVVCQNSNNTDANAINILIIDTKFAILKFLLYFFRS